MSQACAARSPVRWGLERNGFARSRRRSGRYRVVGIFPLLAERSESGGGANQWRAGVAPAVVQRFSRRTVTPTTVAYCLPHELRPLSWFFPPISFQSHSKRRETVA